MAPKEDKKKPVRPGALSSARRVADERQRAEEEIALARERYRLTLASIGEGVIGIDADSRVVFINAVAEQLTGWPLMDANGRPLLEIFHIFSEDNGESLTKQLSALLLEPGNKRLVAHTMLISRDGLASPIDVSVAPMHDSGSIFAGAVLVFRNVAERRQVEAELARLAAIVESSEDAILSKSLEGIVRTWNRGAERLFGYTQEEAIGRPITLIIPPEQMNEEHEILRRIHSGVRVEPFETVRLTKDGRRVNISLTVSPIRDREGRVIGASKIARDITARKQLEQALQEREWRHRFLSNIAAAIHPLARPAEIRRITVRMLADALNVDQCAFGEVQDGSTLVIVDEVAGQFPRLAGRWSFAALGTNFERHLRAGTPYIDDTQLCLPLFKAGSVVAAIVMRHQMVRHWTAAELEFVGTVLERSWDSIERARVVRARNEAADRLALTIAVANFGEWSWDIATDAITHSPRASEIFGLPENSIVTRNQLLKMIHVDDRERAALALKHAIGEKQPYEVEYRLLTTSSEERWVSVRGRAEHGAQGNATSMLGVILDITDRKRLEEELRHRAEKLAEADRQKDDFIALLAHELRNPLAPLRTGLNVIRLAAGNAEAVNAARPMMDRQLAHMVRLIDDLLDVSRLTRNKLFLQKAPVLLSEVISHAMEVAGPEIDAADHQLSVSLPAEPITLDADLTRLAQIFGNILSNSARYTERGGQIWLVATQQDGTAVISIRDNGIGIPAVALPHIFDMFSQVDRSVERVKGGLGIGLALVKGLVEMHAGSINAESAGLGAGSTFTVRLPIVSPRNSLADSSAEISPPTRTGRRVLVVDDNRDGAESMAAMLSLLGNEAYTAGDGVAAVEMAERIRPDIVLMDIGMPRLNGLEATRQIRSRSWARTTKIIAITGWGRDDDRERSRAAGCDGHLVKPVSLPDLEKAIAEVENTGA